jgi:glutamate formiminotransferase/formiminotetrahydrofolate cyclodeaminase
MNLRQFANETASESPAPGGGSISAYAGALGISLATMVANLSAHKKGWETRWEEFSRWAEKGQQLKDRLLLLVDEDTQAFNRIMDGFALPKSTAEEKAIRKQVIQDATKYAIEIPLQVMRLALESMEMVKVMTAEGNPNSITDAGVGGLCARAAVIGAHMNVLTNAAGLQDKEFLARVLPEAQQMADQANELEKEITNQVLANISKA